MKTSKLAVLLAMVAAFGIGSPMLAAEKGGDAMDKVVDGSLIVTRVGGMGASLVLGTPVAVVRDSVHDYKAWTPSLAEHVGGKDFGPSMALVSLVTLPTSLVWGTVTGVFHGTRNSFVKGFNEPFNPESFNITSTYEEK